MLSHDRRAPVEPRIPDPGVAYRGFTIHAGAGLAWISRRGHVVCWADDQGDAKRRIDALLALA